MINKIITYLFSDFNKQVNSKLFKNLLYVFILLKCLLWSLNFDILFGEHALNYQAAQTVTGSRQFAFILYLSQSSTLPLIFLSSLVVSTFFSLVNKRSYILIDLFIYFIIINVNTKTYTALTAGDPLLANLCFLSSFLRKNFAKRDSFFGDLSIVLHNVSFLALITQVCIIYTYSALAKWVDADWQNGTAIDVVNNTYHYSRAFLVDNANSLYPLSFILSYVILLYQSLFPLLIWFKKVKKYILHFGVIMHLYIAFVMGLFFFGLIMALTYSLFYDFDNED